MEASGADGTAAPGTRAARPEMNRMNDWFSTILCLSKAAHLSAPEQLRGIRGL
jgi:hypothetical protein